MENTQKDTNFNENINYYEVKLKLEQYKETVKNITTVQEIESIIPQVKSYIFSEEILRKCFIEQVNLFLTKYNSQENFKLFYKDFEDTYITPIVTNKQTPPASGYSIPNLLYFSVVSEYLNISEFAKRYQNNFIGVLDLYRRLDGAKLDIEFLEKYTREVLNSLDFYIFSQLETSYLYEFITTSWRDLLSSYSPIFNLIWAKSITIGVLHKLLMLISNIYIPQYYNKAFQKIQIIEKINNHESKTKIINTLKAVLQNKNIILRTLVELVQESEKTVKNKRLNIFNEMCTGQAKGELGTTKELLKFYEFKLSDFD